MAFRSLLYSNVFYPAFKVLNPQFITKSSKSISISRILCHNHFGSKLLSAQPNYPIFIQRSLFSTGSDKKEVVDKNDTSKTKVKSNGKLISSICGFIMVVIGIKIFKSGNYKWFTKAEAASYPEFMNEKDEDYNEECECHVILNKTQEFISDMKACTRFLTLKKNFDFSEFYAFDEDSTEEYTKSYELVELATKALVKPTVFLMIHHYKQALNILKRADELYETLADAVKIRDCIFEREQLLSKVENPLLHQVSETSKSGGNGKPDPRQLRKLIEELEAEMVKLRNAYGICLVGEDLYVANVDDPLCQSKAVCSLMKEEIIIIDSMIMKLRTFLAKNFEEKSDQKPPSSPPANIYRYRPIRVSGSDDFTCEHLSSFSSA